MLSVTINSIMLSVVMPNAIILNVMAPLTKQLSKIIIENIFVDYFINNLVVYLQQLICYIAV